MSKRLRKVVHLQVYDFEKNPSAYALKSNKNQFGYIYRSEFYYGKDKIFSREYDNVTAKTFYWSLLRINIDQLKSLRKKVDKLLDRGFAYDNDYGEEINVNVSGGSTIKYCGNNSKDFFQKVLELKR